MTKSPPKPIGRPNTLGPDAIYVTVKLTRPLFKAINRIAGPAPGTRPTVIRQLLTDGIKVARKRVARC